MYHFPCTVKANRIVVILIGLCLLIGCNIIPTLPPQAELLPLPTEEPGGISRAHVRFVKVTEESSGTWQIEVTVQHQDEGEDHFADRWEANILLPDGQIMRYTRELSHPHVDEQPFTRSLSGIAIPEGATEITVRAHDSLHGYGGQEVKVDLTRSSGPGFQVIRKGAP
jgi:hypothetical protein